MHNLLRKLPQQLKRLYRESLPLQQELLKELLKEAGYDGTPVVLLHPTDLDVISKLPLVAKAQLEKAGFKIDLQSMDWNTLVSRVSTKKGPVSEGGWNAFVTSWAGTDWLNPAGHIALRGNGEAGYAGWSARIRDCRKPPRNMTIENRTRRKLIDDGLDKHYITITEYRYQP